MTREKLIKDKCIICWNEIDENSFLWGNIWGTCDMCAMCIIL